MKFLSMVVAGIVGSMLAVGPAPALAPDEGVVVKITEQGYSPDRIEAKAGQKVTWQNATTQDHNVTCALRRDVPNVQEGDKKFLFDSGVIKAGAKFEYTFKEPGLYEYHCGLAPSMKGTVVVLSPK